MMGKSRIVNPIKVGDVFTSNQGYKMTVVEYNNANDVVVEFEDGVRRSARSGSLRSGSVRKPENRVGYKFTNNSGWKGEVIEYKDASNVKVRFQCGEERWTCWGSIIGGRLRSRNQPDVYGVGYVGVGRFIPESMLGRVNDGELVPRMVYNTWRQILKRLYSTNEHDKKNQVRYKGVTMDEDWHNFQNFCEWAVEQVGYDNKDENGRAWNIDKDILIEGNRDYNPEACVYVPNILNKFFSTGDKGEHLYGVENIITKNDRCKVGYISRCSNPLTREREYLGFYDTQEEAHEVYVKRKNEIARDLAKHYEGVVDDRVIEALNNFDIKRRIYLRDLRRDK